MQKEISTYKISFKEKMNMLDLQKINIIKKQFFEKGDEMQMCFDLFVVMCIEIDGLEKTDAEKLSFIQQLTDVSVFNKISETMTEILQAKEEKIEKKKNDENTSSQSELKPEK